MKISRMASVTAGAALSVMLSSAAFAVSSEAECVVNDGTVMDLQNVKHCLVPVIAEEFQGEEYANEIKGVHSCTGALRKTSIGDFCLIALEAKSAATVTPAAVTTVEAPAVSEMASEKINSAIGEASDAKAEMAADAVEAAVEAPKKKGGWLSGN